MVSNQILPLFVMFLLLTDKYKSHGNLKDIKNQRMRQNNDNYLVKKVVGILQVTFTPTGGPLPRHLVGLLFAGLSSKRNSKSRKPR